MEQGRIDIQSTIDVQTETQTLIKEVKGEGKNIILGITGATGALFGLRTLRALLLNEFNVDLIITEYGQYSLSNECGVHITPSNVTSIFPEIVLMKSNVNVHSNLDLKSTLLTTSYTCHGMIIVPCAMGVLARIANGDSGNLIEKCADYALSHSRRLVVIPSETPVSRIHLLNMMRIMEAGGKVIPSCPNFEYKPKDFNDLADYIAGRAIDAICGFSTNI